MQPLTANPGRPILIHLDCDEVTARGVMTEDQRNVAFGEFARAFAPIDVTLTTERPADRRPGSYVTAKVYAGKTVPGENTDGASPCKMDAHCDLYALCYVLGAFGGDPWRLGAVLAHETLHALLPVGRPHDPAGLFSDKSDITGRDILPATVKEVGDRLYQLAVGRRFGFVQRGGVWVQDWHQKNETDPNWLLPVLTPYWLIFARGSVPPMLTYPAASFPNGVRVNDPAADGKFSAVFGNVVYTTTPGRPKDGPTFTFAPGPAPLPEWAPALVGWKILRGGKALVIDPAAATVTVPQ